MYHTERTMKSSMTIEKIDFFIRCSKVDFFRRFFFACIVMCVCEWKWRCSGKKMFSIFPAFQHTYPYHPHTNTFKTPKKKNCYDIGMEIKFHAEFIFFFVINIHKIGHGALKFSSLLIFRLIDIVIIENKKKFVCVSENIE